MSNSLINTSGQITAEVIAQGVKKAGYPVYRTLILGFLAGAFIALAAQGSTAASYNLLATAEGYGLGKALAGTLFGTGLMLVLIAGGELFTGNTMLAGALATRRISLGRMLANWTLVWVSNLAGSLFVAWLLFVSGQFGASHGLLGAVTIKIAAAKTGLGFGPALALGVLCNWLVCLAVWMAAGCRDMAGKILAIFFPVWLFIASGFEHSVANMYYIPAGILALGNEAWRQGALALGAHTDTLDWAGFLGNLVPVTLGNILGGAGLVMMAYWLAWGRPRGEENPVKGEKT